MMQIPILTLLIYCGTNWYELLVVIGAGNTNYWLSLVLVILTTNNFKQFANFKQFTNYCTTSNQELQTILQNPTGTSCNN
jgi:hypothetical protein